MTKSFRDRLSRLELAAAETGTVADEPCFLVWGEDEEELQVRIAAAPADVPPTRHFGGVWPLPAVPVPPPC